MRHSLCVAIVLLLSVGSLQAAQTPTVIRFEHSGSVNSVAFSSDGKKVVTTSSRGITHIWDIESGSANFGGELHQLKGHTNVLMSAAFSPDGKLVASVGYDGTRIWDAKSGTELRRLGSNGFAVAFSPDGTKLATRDGGGPSIWEVDSWKPLYSLIQHRGAVKSIAFSPDGKQIITASADGTANIWDAESGSEVKTLNAHPDMEGYGTVTVNSAVFSPDGKRVATAHQDGVARIWNIESARVVLELRGHNSGGSVTQVSSVAYSPDGKTIVTSSNDRTARIWDAESGEELKRLEVHHLGQSNTTPVVSAVFSPDGEKVATAHGPYVEIWDLERVPPLPVPPPPSVEHPTMDEPIMIKLEGDRTDVDLYWIDSAIAISPDGKKIVTASDESTAQVWDAESGKKLHDLTGHEGFVTRITFSPHGTKIVTAGYDGAPRIWDAELGKELHKLGGHIHLRVPIFSPDGKKIVTTTGYFSSGDNTTRIWDVESGKELHKWEGGFVAFSPDGKQFVTQDNNGIRIWDAESGRELRRIGGNHPSFSPDGTKIVVGARATVLDVHSGRVLQRLDGRPVTFFPDGKKVVTMDIRACRIWDVESGRELQTFQYSYGSRDGDLGQFAISSDGRRIVSRNSGTVRIVDAESGRILATAGLASFGSIPGIPANVRMTTPATFSPDGKKVIAGTWIPSGTSGGEALVRVWDSESGSELQPLRGHTKSVFFAAFSPCGSKIVTASDDRTVRIWTLEQ